MASVHDLEKEVQALEKRFEALEQQDTQVAQSVQAQLQDEIAKNYLLNMRLMEMEKKLHLYDNLKEEFENYKLLTQETVKSLQVQVAGLQRQREEEVQTTTTIQPYYAVSPQSKPLVQHEASTTPKPRVVKPKPLESKPSDFSNYQQQPQQIVGKSFSQFQPQVKRTRTDSDEKENNAYGLRSYLQNV